MNDEEKKVDEALSSKKSDEQKNDNSTGVDIEKYLKKIKKALSTFVAFIKDYIEKKVIDVDQTSKTTQDGNERNSRNAYTNVNIFNNVEEANKTDAKADEKKDTVMSGAMFYFGINLLFYIIVINIIILGANKAYDFSYQIFGKVSVEQQPGKTLDFTIGTGETNEQVADSLQEKNLIKSKYAFLIRLKMGQKQVVPNSYKLTTAMNYGEIIEIICNDEKSKK